MLLTDDSQIQELETYLDGELLPAEIVSLEARLAADASLAQLLIALRRERSLRLEAFAAIEDFPTRATTSTLLASVRKAAVREQVWMQRNRLLRQISAAAACLVVGLFAGWSMRGGGKQADSRPSSQPLASISPNTETGITHPANNPGVSLVSNSGGTRIVPRANGFNVTITDDLGRVLGTQHFDSMDEARQFSNDLGRWQNKQRQLRNSDVKLVGEEF